MSGLHDPPRGESDTRPRLIGHVDELRVRSQTEKYELSHLYKAKIKDMGSAGRNGGGYYTPRPLIRAMVQVVKPQIGERLYGRACGSASSCASRPITLAVWALAPVYLRDHVPSPQEPWLAPRRLIESPDNHSGEDNGNHR